MIVQTFSTTTGLKCFAEVVALHIATWLTNLVGSKKVQKTTVNVTVHTNPCVVIH